MNSINDTFNSLIYEFINPAVYVLSAFAFAWFLFGVFMFILAKIKGEEGRVKTGKQHMLWGLIGLIIIYSASAIYKFITGFFV